MRGKRNVWIAALVMWAAGISVGLGILWAYKSSPGTAAAAPPRWPDGSSLARSPDRATIVMFAHPQCPCTRASLGELAEIMNGFQGRVTAHVVFIRPEGVSGEWLDSDTWRRARELEGVAVAVDPDSKEARRFQVATSGTTVVYDPSGRLVFSGGITAGRGHHGDNNGRRRVIQALSQGAVERPDSPVFGCPLDDGPVI